ncbi:MAG: ABC transporter ATP-binding protein [Eubacteriales bacterium]|nr:ABC transporter ATP-binding protein [Eubacteriales bacterium]
MIEFINVKKSFFDNIVLQNVSFKIEDASIFALIGRNGAGKTTMLKLLLSLIEKDEGEILIDGIKIKDIKRNKIKKIGYISDRFESETNYTLYEYLIFYANCYSYYGIRGKNKVDKVLKKLYLENRKEELVDTFSKGTKAIVALARVLIANPDIFILDEPLDGLDAFSKEEFISILHDLREEGKIIILTSHQFSEVRNFCTHIGILEHTKISEYGAIKDIIKTSIFQKKLIIEIDSDYNNIISFLKREELVQDITLQGSVLYLGFSGKEEDEKELLYKLVQNKFGIRSFVSEYEHNYDF